MKKKPIFIRSVFSIGYGERTYNVIFHNNTEGNINYALQLGAHVLESGEYIYKISAHKTDALNIVKRHIKENSL